MQSVRDVFSCVVVHGRLDHDRGSPVARSILSARERLTDRLSHATRLARRPSYLDGSEASSLMDEDGWREIESARDEESAVQNVDKGR